MKLKRYIVWSTNNIDINNPFQRKWYIKQVLTYGRTEDILSLDWQEIKNLLPEIELSNHIKSLWETYFATQK